MEGTAEAGLEVAQQCIDPPELWQVVGVPAAGVDCLVVAVGRGDGVEQASPPERTWLPGARWRLVQSEFASELKPLTAVILA